MLLRPEKHLASHILPYSEFEPLPLYNHVHVPDAHFGNAVWTAAAGHCYALIYAEEASWNRRKFTHYKWGLISVLAITRS